MNTKEQILFQEQAIDFQLWRSCLNCKHWKPNLIKLATLQDLDVPEIHQICNKFNVKPPLKVIVTSCPEWLPHVPF